MRRKLPSIVLCVSIAILAGCAKPAPKVAKLPEGRRTRLAIAVEKDLSRLREATYTARGLAWAELKTTGDDWKTEAAIVIHRPANLRVDVMDSLADVWAQMGSDGRDLWLYIPGKGKLYRGRATSRNMRKLASFDWTPGDFVSILAGTPPVSEELQIVEVRGGSERHLVDLKSGLHLWVEKGRKRRVLRCVRYSAKGNGIDYEIDFSAYARVGGVEFPHIIEARFPSKGARFKVEYRDVVLGGDVAESIFMPPKRRRGRTVRLKD